jgi:hypothetical protein
MSVMDSLSDISEETLQAIKKAQTAGVLASTGLYGYDLSGVVSLVPVNTPFYNLIPRKSGEGSAAAHWRTLLNVNSTQPNPFVGLDAGGNFINISELDVLANYMPVRVSGKVTRDAIALAKNYADAKAIASTQTLMQWRILENKALIGGQNFALPTIGTVTVTAATTGGAITSGTTYYVKCAARSGYNYYWGGSGIASAAASVAVGTTTSTNKVTATVPSVRGAVAYDWWTSTDNTNYFYTTTTTVNTAVFTAILAAGATVPSVPGLYSTAPSNTVPAADTSYSANSYNGFLATLSGSYLNAGTGLATYGTGSTTVSGATITSLDGATLTASSQGVAEIDAMLMSIWNAAQLSPTRMVMNAQEGQNLALKVLGTNSATTFLTPGDPQRRGFDAGATVSGYINRASGGDRVEIMVDPHWPVGSIGFMTDRIPYPNSGVSNTFEARELQGVNQFDYGVSLTPGGAGSGPREEWDQSSLETFVNRAPVACGVIQNIANG